MPWASAAELAWYRGERDRQHQVTVASAETARGRDQDDVRARRDQMMIGKMCREECDVARDACEYGCEARCRHGGVACHRGNGAPGAAPGLL